MDAAYSARYMKSAAFSYLAILHFIIFGEKRGYSPNPFFDPAYFSTISGGKRLADFLSDQKLWIYSTCRNFDTRWYVDQYHSFLATNENPLSFFWRQGFDLNHNPAPDFDTVFFKRATARDFINKKVAAYNYVDNAGLAPSNLHALEDRQSRFKAKIALNIIRTQHSPTSPSLVIIQAGKDFSFDWLSKSNDFDIAVNYYQEEGKRAVLSDKINYAFFQMGTKVTGISTLMRDIPGFIEAYDAIMILDDDVSITDAQISELFSIREMHNLDLLQAALTSNSECYFPVLKQPTARPGITKVTAVEIMMPVISKRVIQSLGWVFGQGISGWGIDLLLSQQVRLKYGNTIALTGDVVCAHSRPVDLAGGTFYSFLKHHGIDPSMEAGAISMKFNLNDKITAISTLD